MRKPLTLLGMVALLLLAATLALPAAAAPNVCRDLPTGAQAEGAVITVSLAVTDVNGVDWHLVDETIPQGLTVIDTGGANTATSGHLKWSATSLSPDVTYTYKVTGSAGTYTFDGVYLVSGGDETPIDCDTWLEIRDSHLCDFCLELDAGWNLVSVPRMLDGQTNAATVFNLSATELCEYYDGCTGSWSNANPRDMNVMPGCGYMVSKASAETRCLNFDDSGTAIPSNQQLCAGGWNMIGFPSLDSMSVADFGTTAIDGNFTMVWQWNSGWDQVSPPDSNNVIPGKGYLLWMTDDGVLLGMIT